MKYSLPEHIIGHIFKELPPYAGLLCLQTDSLGTLLFWQGSWKHYFNIPPNKGADLAKIIPFLAGMFPLKTNTLQLQNLQLKENLWVDIHLMKDSDTSHWIFVTDRSEEIIKMQGLLQKVNEHQLQVNKPNLDEPCANPFGHLHLFQVATFEKLNNGTYKSIGEVPDWLITLRPEVAQKGENVHLGDNFPFLEIFESEIKTSDSIVTNHFFNSGIWIEADSLGNEYFLRAFATSFDDTEYLLIRMLNDDLLGEQDTMQKAREQQLAFENLAKAQKQLKELLGYKDMFVSIVTHDLRSPIASVLGATEMLTNDQHLMDQLDDFTKELMLGMREEMTRMLDYNDKLYHWSNLELGNFELVKENIEVDKLVKMIVQTFNSKLKKKDIHFSSTHPQNLKIKVDITLFLQALNNLVGNAIKFTPKEGKIQMLVEQDKRHTRITISDTGVGMDEEKAAHLFENTINKSTHGTQGEKGSALGLGIIKKIIEAHKFSIQARSKPGLGTQITIEM